MIIGLGNPGRRYKNTRHNAGFMVVDRLAERHRIKLNKRIYNSKVGEGVISGAHVVLAKTLRFMNLSGQAVAAMTRGYSVGAEDLIVIHDDIDIAGGKIKLKHKGGDAGHKGIRSVIEHLGTRDFTRIRVGVGKPEQGEDTVGYVLGRFGRDELPGMEAGFLAALEAVESLIDPSADEG